MQRYYQGTNNNAEHRGDWNIRNGVEIDEQTACSIVDAVSHACALVVARGGRCDFDLVKKIAQAAKFGAGVAVSNIEYINGRVREQQKLPQDDRSGGADNRSGGGNSYQAHSNQYRRETDDLY